MKHEWKKHEKPLYLPKKTPERINVPEFGFYCIDGQGHPASDAFAECVEALYATSYAVRMSHKGDTSIDGFFEYTVYPLEGVWDLVDPKKGAKDKNNFKYTLMIRQPEFLTEELAATFIAKAFAKKKKPAIERVRFERRSEGACVQMLHLGCYDDEPASFARMEEFCKAQGLRRVSKLHREIYLSDARKVAPEKRKTVLRIQVEE